MSDPRIGDVSSGAPAQPSTKPPEPRRFVTVLSTHLSSPRGVLVVIPALVAVLGLFLTAVGQEALRGSNLEVANERLTEQTQLVARSVSDALGQADPLLDRLIAIATDHDASQPYERIAHTLADLMRGRAGVTYLSISFPDGTFQGSYLDDDGSVRFQDSRIEDDGTRVRRFDVTKNGVLTLYKQDRTTYDPRSRSFYQLAVAKGARAWTAPYPFFESHQTGITRVAPVFKHDAAEPTLHAVVTVDFDVHALSSHLSGRRLPGTRALLFARDGTILAYTTDAVAEGALPRPADHVLTQHDLNDPVVDALLSQLKSTTTDAEQSLVIEASGARYLVALASATTDASLPWSMAFLAPEAQFLHGLHEYQRESVWIGASALLVAVLIAFLFARSITRARREVATARADAAQARKEAKELGSYRLVSCLGKGAMGEVWRAEHRLLARQAAIKLINPDLRGKNTAEIRGRFRREAETLASLRSRNTIELFDYGVAGDGTFFFVMELLDGMDLDTLVERHGPQPAARVVQLLIQACNSLAEAHDRGLVHRDIKPANIFICRAADEVDVVKVLDFGLVLADDAATRVQPPLDTLANALPDGLSDALPDATTENSGKLTHAGGLMGTPAFMPPEQAMGHVVDGRADIYALACVAVWLLHGRLVFAYDNPMQLLIAHMNEAVPDLRAMLPSTVPDALVALLTRCLQKEPDARPRDMRELGRALRALPQDRAWNDETAQTWWAQQHPAQVIASSSLPPAEPSAPTLLSLHL